MELLIFLAEDIRLNERKPDLNQHFVFLITSHMALVFRQFSFDSEFNVVTVIKSVLNQL